MNDRAKQLSSVTPADAAIFAPISVRSQQWREWAGYDFGAGLS